MDTSIESVVSIYQTVEHAIELLKENDTILFHYGLREEAIGHRLAIYLENLSPKGFDVDCEYNKRIDVQNGESEPKFIVNRDVIPDIVIHKRGNNTADDNLLVIQLKKKSNQNRRTEDIESLIEFTKQNGIYKYQHGLFLDIDERTCEITQKWFKNGIEDNISHE